MKRLGLLKANVKNKNKKYKPKPYEHMCHPDECVQIEVKAVPKSCISSRLPGLRLYQFTEIDEYSRVRFLDSYDEQSTYTAADFLKRTFDYFAGKGIEVKCVQIDNGFEFTNRFSRSERDLPTLFENMAVALCVRHKLIRPYTPRHSGKVERSYRVKYMW